MKFSGMNIFTILSISFVLVEFIFAKKCPKYACSKGSSPNACASVEPDTEQNKVYLNDICKKEDVCVVPPKPWEAFADATTKLEYVCDKQLTPTTQLRYPGEACSADIDCFQSKHDQITGHCKDGKCAGLDKDAKCEEHGQCPVGYYCGKNLPDDKDKACKEQKKDNAQCSSSLECINTLLCHAGTCSVKPYSLPLGTRVDGSYFPTDMYCQLGYAYKGVCSSLNQTDTTSKDMDYLKQCNYGDVCTYTNNGIETVTLPCECGYNENGYGYCPRGHDTSIFYLTCRN
jgi:hypothetical protein